MLINSFHIPTEYRIITMDTEESQWPRDLRHEIGIVGSNRTQGMDVCPHFFCVCVVLFKQRPCDGLIPRPRSPTDCL
jgi:hypothetical protein